jgi:hypothetical protein
LTIVVLTGVAAFAEKPTEFCAEVEFRASPESSQGWHRGGFSASEIVDLEILVGIVPPVLGRHLLELDLYTPNGHLYQTLTVPLATDLQTEGLRVRVPGYRDPLRIQVLKPTGFGDGVHQGTAVRFAVGGTNIVTNSIYGAWEVRPRLDGNPMSCEKIIRFDLGP